MNYWLVNPKKDGSFTDLSDLKIDCVYMGWEKDVCRKFYNDVKKGDVIIVAEGKHSNSNVHYIGIAEKLNKDEQCWCLSYSTQEKNEEIANIIKKKPGDFGGGNSPNPWGPAKSIIKLNENEAEKEIKKMLNTYFKEVKMKEKLQQYVKLLGSNYNLILTGAPGTGKTYLAKQIAAQLILGKEYDENNDSDKKQMDEQCGFVQFHPSYDYTDFVEGLRPENDDNGNVGFRRVNGIFKTFCAKAISSQKKDNVDNFNEKWDVLIDELNENDFINVPFISNKEKFFRVELNEYGTGLANRTYLNDDYKKGEWMKGQSKFFSKEQLYNIYRGESGVPSGGHDNYRKAVVNYMKEKLGLKDYQIGTIIENEKNVPFVFIIDEINRGEISKIFGELFFSIDPGYRGEKGRVQTQYQNMIEDGDIFKNGFFVPENVYVIGTMNDIDRSVESMDFAFRRRFAFKEIKAKENIAMLNLLESEVEKRAENRMNNLNRAIEKVEGLSSAYHIGASYFLKLKDYNNDFDKLWKYHFEGLLCEYLRGMQDVEGKLEILKNAYNNELDSDNGQQT